MTVDTDKCIRCCRIQASPSEDSYSAAVIIQPGNISQFERCTKFMSKDFGLLGMFKFYNNIFKSVSLCIQFDQLFISQNKQSNKQTKKHDMLPADVIFNNRLHLFLDIKLMNIG